MSSLGAACSRAILSRQHPSPSLPLLFSARLAIPIPFSTCHPPNASPPYSGECTFNVVVLDKEAPKITCRDDMEIEQDNGDQWMNGESQYGLDFLEEDGHDVLGRLPTGKVGGVEGPGA